MKFSDVAAMSAVVLSVIALSAGPAAFAEVPSEQGVAIGQPVPDFTLMDYSGKEHTLSGLKGQVVVLVCCSQECPWSRGAQPELSKMAKDYAGKDVAFLGIDSNRSTTPSEIRAYAIKEDVPYPILKDTNNVYADELGARHTPEVYIVDTEGKLVYHGAVDNRKAPTETGDTNYVKLALDSVLAGKEVATKEVRAWGCGIKRVPKIESEPPAASGMGNAPAQPERTY